MTLSASEVNKLRFDEVTEGVHPTFRQRWSPRAFLEREVAPSVLRNIFESARWAASSGNGQPWRFLMGVRPSATYRRIATTLAGFNQEWAPRAPVLILGVTNTLNAKGAVNAYALYDLGAASAFLTLGATTQGLAAHQMGGFDHDAIRKALDIPESYLLGSVIALGYQGEPEHLANETLVSREIAPRGRKQLSEMVFTAWGEPANLG
jgi:nitroreductase